MIYVVIEQPKTYAGRWELDVEQQELSTRELGWVKRFSGYLPLTMGEGLAGGDAELFAAYAVIALVRNGKITREEVATVFERIIDQPFGTALRIETDDAEVEGEQGGPPTQSTNSSGDTSGHGSTQSSETSDAPQNGSGTQGSEPLESDLQTLVT